MDVSKIRIGDTVHVRATVVEIDQSSIPVAVEISGERLWLRTADIGAHESRPLQVGDVTQMGTVLAIHGKEAWVERHGLGCHTYYLSGLERVAS